jgi:two-component system NarL family response regulator
MTARGNIGMLIVINNRGAVMHERICMIQGVRVLIVDDQRRARQSLKALLGTWPMVETIQEAANGQEALALVQESPPDLILMDLHRAKTPALPKGDDASVDGLEATRRIRAKWPQVKIIVLSVHTERAAEARAAGADAFVCKCEPPEALLKALEQVTKDRAV